MKIGRALPRHASSGHEAGAAPFRSLRQRTNLRLVTAIVVTILCAGWVHDRSKVRVSDSRLPGFVDWSGVHVVSGTFRADRRPLGKREHPA
jgi:hypothetical protein